MEIMETNFYGDSREYFVKDTLYPHDLSKIAKILMKVMTHEIKITNVERVYESNYDLEYIEIEYRGHNYPVESIKDAKDAFVTPKKSESKEISW